jgi:DNA polymerase III epsilon subunit-like protein
MSIIDRGLKLSNDCATNRMMPMSKGAKFILIDTEASGFHPHKHGLLEVAALALDSNLEVVDTYHHHIKPPEGVEYDPYAMRLNGIDQDTIESGLSYKEFCESFIDFVKTRFSNKPIAIAQFYPFDNAYLNYVFEYCGYGITFNVELFNNDFIDTKSIVNAINLKAELAGDTVPFPITSLSKPGGLKDTLEIKPNGHDAHTAIGDVLATRDVLKKLIEYLC